MDERVLDLAYIHDKSFLLFCSFFEQRSDSIENNLTARKVGLTFALFAMDIRTDERYFLTFGVDAHPLDGLGVVAVESLGLADVEKGEHCLELSIPVASFFHFNKISDKKYRLIII